MRQINWVRVLGRLFLPSKFSIVLLVLALAWVLLAGGCSAAVGGAVEGASFGGVLTGLLVVPIGAAIAFVAAILAGTSTARSLLFGLTAIMTGLGLVLVPLGDFMGSGKIDPGGIILSVILYVIPITLTGALSAFFGARGLKEITEQVSLAREQRLCEVLLERGEASFPELSAASGIAESLVDDVLESRIAAGSLAAVLDVSSQRAFTLAKYQTKEQELVATVQARGKASIYDVAKALGLSEGHFRQMLYDALSHGRFAGYVDFRRGVVFSVDARKLREGKQCPSCGGKMDLAGNGVLACTFCGAEVLLA